MRLIGDIHGNFEEYQSVISDCDESVQLGDFGIGFRRNSMLTNCIMGQNHKFIYGNHDNTDKCLEHPNCLGHFGMHLGMFFVSGGFSIDRAHRTEGRDWWATEELSIAQGNEALNMYEKLKPDIVISHEAPLMINQEMYRNTITSRTSQLLDAMFNVHQPKNWYFGHHHNSFELKIDKTFFRCLNTNEYVDI